MRVALPPQDAFRVSGGKSGRNLALFRCKPAGRRL